MENKMTQEERESNLKVIKSFNEKINKIQREIGILKKDKAGYNYHYVDINQLLDKLVPLLEGQNLLLTQPIVTRGDISVLKSEIFDFDTGATKSSEIVLPRDVKPQDMGSAITYYRRYSLVSLFAIQAEDDDGKSAVKKAPVKKEEKKEEEDVVEEEKVDSPF